MTPLRIVHVITGLDLGGAEIALYRYIANSQGNQFDNVVISLKAIGPVGNYLSELGIETKGLGLKPGRPNPAALWQLAQVLKKTKPDIVQTWMYHADFLGGLAAKLVGLPIVWGIRNSTLDRRHSNVQTRILVWLNAKLASWMPNWTVSNSDAARDWHISLGYPRRNFTTIPNGLNVKELWSNAKEISDIRKALTISAVTKLVGLFGRYDPQKGHSVFLEAAAKLAGANSTVQFILAGNDVNWDNLELKEQIDQWPQLRDKIHLLGPREDMATLLASLDLLVSASVYGESFPNIVAEAMALQVPCVVTDIGDSAKLVDSIGLVVTPGDADKLFSAMKQALDWPVDIRQKRVAAGRQKIANQFSIEKMLNSYEQLYRVILQDRMKA